MNYILLFIATASILTVHDQLHSIQIEYSWVLSYPIHDTGGHYDRGTWGVKHKNPVRLKILHVWGGYRQNHIAVQQEI
ncbi:hypothetical protein EDD15DRAFT_2295464 [Pisolithus albus]|nr:hypothetical protein EDD15DRAFT_2295464 [Pisolithus albus]